jgi:hypothetical protein
MTFLLSDTSVDWKRLKRDGFNLCPFGSNKVSALLKSADWILFSKDVNMGNIFAERYR